jgi:hypothetical protein
MNGSGRWERRISMGTSGYLLPELVGLVKEYLLPHKLTLPSTVFYQSPNYTSFLHLAAGSLYVYYIDITSIATSWIGVVDLATGRRQSGFHLPDLGLKKMICDKDDNLYLLFKLSIWVARQDGHCHQLGNTGGNDMVCLDNRIVVVDYPHTSNINVYDLSSQEWLRSVHICSHIGRLTTLGHSLYIYDDATHQILVCPSPKFKPCRAIKLPSKSNSVSILHLAVVDHYLYVIFTELTIIVDLTDHQVFDSYPFLFDRFTLFANSPTSTLAAEGRTIKIIS